MPPIGITDPVDFEDKVKETIRTKIGIEPPSMTEEEYGRLSNEKKRMFDRQLKIYRDWFSTLMYERKTGYRIGLRTRVFAMLHDGIPKKEISKLTGQSVEQLEYLLSTTDEE